MAKPQRIRRLSKASKASDAARRIVAARLSDVTRWEEQVPALAPVHAMRVATRRLRQALKLFGLGELDAQAKRLQDALGSLRDLQLQAEWLAPRDERLRRQRERLVPKAEKKLLVALRAFRGKTVPAVLSATQKLQLRGKLGGHRMRRKLEKKIAKFDARLEAALKSDKPDPMHRLRIAAKQFRYTCELLENAVDAAPPLLAELTPLQESLGDLHDADVRVTLLRRHGRKALLREEQEVRARLARLVGTELQRWQARGVSDEAVG